VEREQVKECAARWDRRGYSQVRIVEKVVEELSIRVHQTTISALLREVREDYKGRTFDQRSALVAEKVEQYRDIVEEMWDAWYRSREPGVVETEEECEGGRGGGYSKTGRTTRRQVGDRSYLALAKECYDRICDLFGLDAPRKVVGQVGAVGSFNWEEVMGEIPEQVPDTVEEEIGGVGTGGTGSDVPAPKAPEAEDG